MNEQDLKPFENQLSMDVLDENLYGFDNIVFTLSPAVQQRTTDSLMRKIEQCLDAALASQKATEKLKRKTEYIPRFDLISCEIKKLLNEGKLEFIPCKDANSASYLQIRSTINGLIVNGQEYGKFKKVKDIPFSANTSLADATGAMQCLSMQNQLNRISEGIKELSEVCEVNFGRVLQGQRDDRLAKLFHSRSCFIQALALSNEFNQQQMLLEAIQGSNSARAELAFQIRADISVLNNEKALKTKDNNRIVNDIRGALIAMNNSVQISLYSYQTLGEHMAQLSVIKEYEIFLKQVLLKEIQREGEACIAWELICSSGKSQTTPQALEVLPEKLLNNCAAFLDNKKEVHSINGEGVPE